MRNFHQGFEHGLFAGMLNTGLGMLTGGRDLWLVDPQCDPRDPEAFRLAVHAGAISTKLPWHWPAKTRA